jgi:hypothetical protein
MESNTTTVVYEILGVRPMLRTAGLVLSFFLWYWLTRPIFPHDIHQCLLLTTTKFEHSEIYGTFKNN